MVKVIDGTDLLLGHLCTFTAKHALEGEQVYIINAEKVAISGNKQYVIEKFSNRRDRGEPFQGPFYPKRPDHIVKRAIRGMLPYKKERGEKALKRVKVFIGAPELKAIPEPITLPGITVNDLKIPKYIYVGELSKFLGWTGGNNGKEAKN